MRRVLQRTIFVLSLALLQTALYSQTVSWQWAKGAGAAGSEAASATAIDPSGNLFVAGWYTSANITFGATTLTNPSGITADFFLTKYDAAGNVLWAKSYGGADGDIATSVATDASGNAYVTGIFSGSVMVMGSFTLTNASTGTNDMFLAKIDAAGNVVWAKNAGGTSHDKPFSIALDLSGNIFVAGAFGSSSINFGTGALNNTSTTDDAFLVKYDQTGAALWARSAGGTSPDQATAVSTDSVGNVYIAGKFSSASVNFGTGALNNASSGTQDIFVVKYNSAGTAQWSARSGGTMDDAATAIVVSNGGVYVGGGFSSTSMSVGSTTLSNATPGIPDVFLVKYDNGGNPQWAKATGGADFDVINSLAADASGNVYAGGYFISNSLSFGSNALNSSSPGYKDLFVVEYDAMGNPLWATSAPGNFNDAVNTIAVTSNGSDIYIGGGFDSGPLVFGTINIYKGCGDDVFVAKMQAPTVGIKEMSAPEVPVVYPNPSNGKITVDADGQITFYNVLGQEILKEKLEGKKQFDLSSVEKGVYIYKIVSKGKQNRTGRIIIE
jgi:hypothetical protein